MKNPLVSIVMITYGHEQFIKEAIEGVLMQICNFEIELIISNDCSPDNTDKIINEIIENDSRSSSINYIKHSKNIGMMPNFIFTLNMAQAKYIALCEGDDFWTDPLKLQKQVDFLEINNEYVMCSHDAKIIDSFGNVLKESKLPNSFKKDATSDELKKGFWLLTLGMMFRNSTILKNFPKEGYDVVNGDIFLISLLGQYGRSKYMSEVEPACYREHSGGIWSMTSKITKKINNFNTLFFIGKYYERIDDKVSKEIFLSCYIKGYWVFLSSFKYNWNFSSQLKILKYTFVSFIKIKSLKYVINGINKTFFLLIKKIVL